MKTHIIKALTLLVILSFSAISLKAKEKKPLENQIIVGYAKNTDPKQIKSLEDKFKIKVIKKFKRIYAICYEIPVTQNIPELINLIQQEKIVKYAEKNGKIAKKS
ncbi:MAG: hypothetical protein MK132_12630 [Lentisphaerales bacterium]|nr:hypothetical protein [Lentisphaerales bacterium]